MKPKRVCSDYLREIVEAADKAIEFMAGLDY